MLSFAAVVSCVHFASANLDSAFCSGVSFLQATKIFWGAALELLRLNTPVRSMSSFMITGPSIVAVKLIACTRHCNSSCPWQVCARNLMLLTGHGVICLL